MLVVKLELQPTYPKHHVDRRKRGVRGARADVRTNSAREPRAPRRIRSGLMKMFVTT
jgi:hypothetical protein